MSLVSDTVVVVLIVLGVVVVLVVVDSVGEFADSSRVDVSKTLMVARGVILYSLAIRCSIK